MAVEKLIIEVSADSRNLDPILNKLVEAKQLSKEAADQFRKDSDSFASAARKRNKLLEEEIQDLNELKLKKQQAFSVEEIQKYNRSIKQTEERIRALRGETERQNESFLNTNRILKNVGATLLATFTIDRIARFTKEAVQLAAELEGVKNAFDKLNNPDLLADLRKATRGTVTDLELMRKAVLADKFKIPLKTLGSLFDFATKRAIETGQSVDYLVESIVNGIGRKSPLILDNLGLSVIEIRKELRKTGDFSVAVSNVISRELEKTGNVADTTATKLSRLAASAQNAQASIGGGIISAFTGGDTAKRLDLVREAEKALGKEVLNTAYIEAQRNKNFQNYSAITQQNIILETKAVKELVKEYQKVIDAEEERRKIAEAKELYETLKEAEKALNKRVSSPSRAAARFGIETKEVENLLNEYDKYLVLENKGLSQAEIYAKLNEKEYKQYLLKTKAIQERVRAEEEYNSLLLEIRRQAKKDFNLDDITGETERKRTAELEKIFDLERENDAKNAEAFDKAQKNQENRDAEDRKRLAKNLEFERNITDARIDLAKSVVASLASLASGNAEAQKAFLAFEKLAAISEVLIMLPREIAINSATLPPLARDAANIQSRLRAYSGIAQITATAIPQFQGFAKGVIDLQGKGTETSDDIPAFLSKGESVMTAKETREHKELFKAIRQNQFDDFIFKNHTLPVLKNYVSHSTNYNSEFHDGNIVTGLKRNRDVLYKIHKSMESQKKHQLRVN